MRRGDEILPVPTFPIFRGQNNKKQQRNIFVALVASQRAREDGAFLNLAFLSDWFTFFIIFFFFSHFFKSKSGNGSVTIFRGRPGPIERAFINFFTLWWFSDRRETFRIAIFPSKRFKSRAQREVKYVFIIPSAGEKEFSVTYSEIIGRVGFPVCPRLSYVKFYWGTILKNNATQARHTSFSIV